jgi:integrase
MPRRAGPWYRRERAMWFATHLGKQHPLGITDPDAREAAEAALRELVARLLAAPPKPADAKPSRPVGALVPEYLRTRKVSAGTLRAYRFALETHFLPAFGARPLASLAADEIEAWADRPGWSSSYRHNTLGAVGTFLAWAGHPLDLHRPPKESRGGDTVLSDAQFARVLAAYDSGYGGDLAALLTVLRETGARPQEVARLTCEVVDWPNACARLKGHKTARHGRARTLYFSAAAAAVLAAQRAKYAGGFLFRTRKGNPYTEKAIVQQMQRLSKRVGFRAIAYGAGRHSFATKALVEGVADTVVAAILGHGSTRMVHANYSHVAEQSRALRAAVERVSAAKPA